MDLPGLQVIMKPALQELEDAINTYCVLMDDGKGKLQISLDNFFHYYYHNGMKLFLALARKHITLMLHMLFCFTTDVLSSPVESMSESDLLRVCVYLRIANECVKNTNTDSNTEILEENLARQLTNYCIIIIIPREYRHKHKTIVELSRLLHYLADRSKILMDCFVSDLVKELYQNEEEPVTSLLYGFVYLAIDLKSLETIFSSMIPIVSVLITTYPNAIDTTIYGMIQNAIKNSPGDFSQVFAQKKEIKYSRSLLDSFEQLLENRAPYSKGYFALQLIQEDIQSPEKIAALIISKLSRINDPNPQNIVHTIESFNIMNIIIFFTQRFKEYIQLFTPFLFGYIKTRRLEDRFTVKAKEALLVYYPLVLLKEDAQFFHKNFEVFLFEPRYMLKLIYKACTHNVNCEFAIGYIINSVIQKENFAKHTAKYLFKIFSCSLSIFESVIRIKPDSIGIMLKHANSYKNVDCLLAIDHYADKNRTDLNFDDHFWLNIHLLTSEICSIVKFSALYTNTPFDIQISSTIVNIGELMLSIPEIKDTSLKFVIHNLELCAILLLSTSFPFVHKNVGIILQLTINILRQNKFESEIPMSILEEIKKSAETSLLNITAKLKQYEMRSSVIKTVSGTLSQSLISATRRVYPKLELTNILSSEVLHENVKPINIITIDLPRTFALLLSLRPHHSSPIFELLNIFLRDEKFIGEMTLECLPPNLVPSSYGYFMELILKWTTEMQIQKSVFNVKTENTVFIYHSMIVITRILEQNIKGRSNIEPNILSQLGILFTSYCSLIMTSDLHNQCFLFLIAMMTKYPNEISQLSRRIMSNHLGMWLSQQNSRYDNEKLLIALSILLDGISFDDVQNKFMFFVDASIRALHDDSALFNAVRKVLISIFKSNIRLAIIHCLSEGLSSDPIIKSVLLSAIACILRTEKIPVLSLVINEETPLIDLIFDPELKIFSMLTEIIPFSSVETASFALLQASWLKEREFDVLDLLIKQEIASNKPESKNSLFRGNGITSRIVSMFPRIIGRQWVINTLNPIITEIINMKEKCVINPEKLSTDDDLYSNQVRFREVLIKIINTIVYNLNFLPNSLVKASQLLYRRICERFDDVAKSIVIGFIFLRFIIPYINSINQLGINIELPEDKKAVLLDISIILMSATLKPSLSEKAAFYHPFNDLALDANNKFKESINSILGRKVGSDRVSLEINEVGVTDDLIKVLSDIQNVIIDRSNNFANNEDLTKRCKMMLHYFVQVPEEPSEKRRAHSLIPLVSSQFSKIMNADYLPEELFQLKSFCTRDNNVIYVLAAKRPNISNINALYFHFFTLIQEITDPSFSIVVDYSNYDSAKFKKHAEIGTLLSLCPNAVMNKFKCLCIICPPPSIIYFFATHKRITAFNGKLFFILDMQSLVEKIGKVSNKFSACAVEALSDPESVHSVIVNGKESLLRLHEKSIQILQDRCVVSGADAFSQSVIFLDKISEVTPGQSEFFIVENGKQRYRIQTRAGSNLNKLLFSAIERYKPSKPMKNIELENDSIQWNLLNLAVINILTNTNNSQVNFASLQLIQSVIKTFNVKHTSLNIDVDQDLVPPNCRQFIFILSIEMSKMNREIGMHLITQFIKMIKTQSKDVINMTLPVLAPWIPVIIEAVSQDDFVKMVHMLVDFYIEHEDNHKTFEECIWSRFIIDEEKLTIIFRNKAILTHPFGFQILSIITQANHILSSTFLSVKMTPLNVELFTDLINSLFVTGLFDVSAVPALFYKIVKIKDTVAKTKIHILKNLFSNVYSYLCMKYNVNNTNLANEASEILYSTKYNIQSFDLSILNLKNLVLYILQALDKFAEVVDLMKQVFNPDSESIHDVVSAFFISASFEGEADSLAMKIINIFGFDSEESCIITSHVLSCLKFSNMFAQKMLMVSILLLNEQNSSSIHLLSNCLKQIDLDNLKLTNIKEIGDLLVLPIVDRPLYTLAVLISYFDKEGICNDEIAKLSEKEPLFKIMNRDIDYVKKNDFNEDLITAACVAFTCFLWNPMSRTEFDIVKLIQGKKIETFYGINCYKILCTKKKINEITDSQILLDIGKIEFQSSHSNDLPPFFVKHFQFPYIFSLEQRKPFITELLRS